MNDRNGRRATAVRIRHSLSVLLLLLMLPVVWRCRAPLCFIRLHSGRELPLEVGHGHGNQGDAAHRRREGEGLEEAQVAPVETAEALEEQNRNRGDVSEPVTHEGEAHARAAYLAGGDEPVVKPDAHH